MAHRSDYDPYAEFEREQETGEGYNPLRRIRGAVPMIMDIMDRISARGRIASDALSSFPRAIVPTGWNEATILRKAMR